MRIKFGDVYAAKINMDGINTLAPVVIVQNDIANKHSDKVIVCIIDTELQRAKLPTHLTFKNKEFDRDTVILTEEIMSIRKERLLNKITCLCDDEQSLLKEVLQVTFQIKDF